MMPYSRKRAALTAACALMAVLFALAAGKTACADPAIAFTDVAGREVTLDKRPQTFIVANYIANFLMVGGAESLDKVVGMTFDGWEETRCGEYAVYTRTFPRLKEIPSIGGYHDDILDSEKILALKPDVLLVGRSQFADNNQKIGIFERAGIRVVVLDYHAMKVENHTQSTRILGRLLGREAVAEEQCEAYASALKDVYARVAALPESAKHKRVYMELGNKGLGEYGNSYNKDVLWGAILKKLGADSLAENASQPYAPLDREFVLASNPEIIIIGGGIWRNNAQGDQMSMGLTIGEDTAQSRLKGFAQRPAWASLAAVQSGEVYSVDHGSLRNMIDYTFTLYLAKVLYPETFGDLDPMQRMRAFYAAYLPELDFDGTFMIRLAR